MSRIIPCASALLFCCAVTVLAQSTTQLDRAFVEAMGRADCRSAGDMLKKGASPNAKDDEGVTPLMRAAMFCEPSVIALLIDRGGDVNAADAQGRTPLAFAIDRDPPDKDFAKRQMDAIRLLLARKASTAAKAADGSTVLHQAARQRNVDVLKLALTFGVPIDTRNKDGATPLFVAAADGRTPQNVDVLIAAGADVNARNNYGMSVLDVAKRAPEIAQRLEARGARAGAPPAPRSTGTPPAAGQLAPIDGVSLEQWARANGRLVADVPLGTVLASLKLDQARWERVNDQWSARLAQNAQTIGAEYARIFRAAIEAEVGTAEPMSFERWVEVQAASSAASERVPALYGLNRADWGRVQAWWNQRMQANGVEKALYTQLSDRYEKQFAAKFPNPPKTVLRDGALESNREPVSLETWVEMQQADAAAQAWTLKRQGLTTNQWIRASLYWGRRFNEAVLSMDSGTPAERAAKRQMYADHQRLSDLYKKKYAQGAPW